MYQPDYDKTSKALTHQLTLLEEMVHSQEDFVMTDSEFAFGWHFFVLSVNKSLVLNGRNDGTRF